MELNEFMERIGLDGECQKTVRDTPVTQAALEGLPNSSWLEENYCGDRPEYVLSVFVRYLAEHGEKAYLEKGFSEEVWLDTMRDLSIWSQRLRRERGELGLRETGWLSHHVRAEIFRLGRLQFVPRVSETPTAFGEKRFPAGTPYCEVHVPDGGPLAAEKVEGSFRLAVGYFAPAYFSCESWLLSPRVKELLPDGNIAAFAARFTVTETFPEDRSAERYIFGRIAPPQEYEPYNAFSEKVKEAALRGEFFGAGTGYFASK